MYFVYLISPYGTELIGKSNDKSIVEKIKSEQDSKWEVGCMWTTELTEEEKEEVSYYD